MRDTGGNEGVCDKDDVSCSVALSVSVAVPFGSFFVKYPRLSTSALVLWFASACKISLVHACRVDSILSFDT